MAMLNIADFEAAYENARGHIHRTPLLSSETLSGIAGARVMLKAELFQKTGSYKIRGPLNVLGCFSS